MIRMGRVTVAANSFALAWGLAVPIVDGDMARLVTVATWSALGGLLGLSFGYDGGYKQGKLAGVLTGYEAGYRIGRYEADR